MTGKRRAGRDPIAPPPKAAVPPPTPAPSRAPQSAPYAVTKPPTRRELRAQRRRQRRRRLGAVGVAGILVGVIVLAAAIGFGVHKVTSKSSGPSRTQTTALMSLVGANGDAVESALLAHDSKTKQGVELFLPSRVITQVCGFGTQQFGHIVALPDGARLSRAAASQMLGGVTVDGSWVLSTAELARLIDEVGGITVDVDTDVIQGSGNQRVLLVQRGPGQHLTGSRAVAYATYLAPGEDNTANLARLQTVFEGLASALARQPAAAPRLISSLGGPAASTLGAQRLADLLTGIGADLKTNNVFPSVLPVVKIDSGGQPAYRVDTGETSGIVRTNLAASVPESAKTQRSRVLIQNGVGTPGLAGPACTKLVDAGFDVVGTGNAASFTNDASKVVVFGSSVHAAELGDRVARALRLSTNDVESSNAAQNVADVIVILGKDFRP